MELIWQRGFCNIHMCINKRYSYDPVLEVLYKDGKAVKLNFRQQRLVMVLCKSLNHSVSFETLSNAIWGEVRNQGSVFRTLVYTVRKLLPDFPIESCSKEGYILRQIDCI